MKRDKILVVDDIMLNRIILTELLENDYEILEACDGAQAIEIIMKEKDSLSLVLMDIMMPVMNGFEALEILKNNGITDKIPVIVITSEGNDNSEIKVLRTGAVDYIEKPFNPDIIKNRISTHIELKKHRIHLEELVAENIQKVVKIQYSLIDAMASLIEYRDVESGQHVARTKHLAESLMTFIKDSNIMEDQMENIKVDIVTKAVPLHDIGKISIPDHILLKPSRLTTEEFEIMKQHTVLGAKIIDTFNEIGDSQYLMYCREICLCHHERWDGKGYPCGLKGNQIPFPARVMTIVDSYDAMINERVYKKALSKDVVIDEIINNTGTQFDPELANAFLMII